MYELKVVTGVLHYVPARGELHNSVVTVEKFNNVEEVWSEAAISYLLSRSKL